VSQLPPKRGKSVVLTTAFSASVVSCVVIGLALAGVYGAQRRIYENRLVDDVKQNVARVTAFIVGYFYAQNNWMHLEEAQTQLNQSPNVIYSYVVGSSGQIDLGLRGLSSPDLGSRSQTWEPSLPVDLEKTVTQTFPAPVELADRYVGRVGRGESVVLIGAPIFCGVLGKNCGQLRVAMSFESIRPTLRRLLGSLVLLFVLLGGVIAAAVYVSIRRNLFPVRALAERLRLVARHANESPSSFETVLQETRDAGVFAGASDFEETANLKSSLEDFTSALQRSATMEKEFALSKSFVDLASQVAHDIRSPLSALNVVADVGKELPETHRNLLRAAATRINDIANHLLTESRAREKKTDSSSSQPTGAPARDTASVDNLVLVAAVVDSVATEKRLEFQSKAQVSILTEFPDDAGGTFSKVSRLDLERALSNTINNAVDALETGGIVTLSVSSNATSVGISITDNGKGIPADVLPRLGKKGATFGKENGNGLGLAHARAFAEAVGGELEITSEVGIGTTVRLTLPRHAPPDWFASRISISGYDEIVVVDDDPSIHQVWEGRLTPFVSENGARKVVHYSSLSELIKGASTVACRDRRALFLVDYEFTGESWNGLQVIEELRIASDAILVSSHYDDSVVPRECLRVGVRLLPKFMAPGVPLV